MVSIVRIISFRLTRSSYTASSKINLRRHQFRQRLLQQKTNVKSAPALRMVSKSNLRKMAEKGKQQQAKKQALVQELRNRRVFKKEEEPPKKAEEKEVGKREISKSLVVPQKNPIKEEQTVSQRPTRKTKEAAAIYMEILGHKLISEGRNDDDDNVSIDSFPELPNVRRTEQRENELKAKAKVSDKKSVSKSEVGNEKDKSKVVKAKVTTVSKPPEQKMMTRNKSQLLQAENKANKLEVKMSEAKITKCRNRRIELEAIKASIIKAYDTSSDSDAASEQNVKKLRGKETKAPELPKKPDKANTETTIKPHVRKPAEKITKLENVVESNFNDSDEEPLAKFTVTKSSSSVKSNVSTVKKEDVIKGEKSEKKENEQSELNSSAKPKRECTRKTQNYLFSSSDDDEKYFHGFVETKMADVKAESECPVPVVASADLLRKDVGKRFGKGKVNMSNEQIEKWLKDSAMAGSSVKLEDDEMLKYGERIPTDTTFDLNLLYTINTENLKTSLLTDVKSSSKEQASLVSPLKQTPQKPIPLPKPYSNDRKPIFRKERQVTPNANAFSARNECSVYAFGEENEDAINTPFRRPMRRPSSTATSKSEDDSSKQEDSNKSSGTITLSKI